MRLALLSYNARAHDAVGNHVAEPPAFFLERGSAQRVFVHSPYPVRCRARACGAGPVGSAGGRAVRLGGRGGGTTVGSGAVRGADTSGGHGPGAGRRCRGGRVRGRGGGLSKGTNSIPLTERGVG